jgi:hypothetical protein
MLHRTAQERYAKLRNVFKRLKVNFNRDDLDDFIQTANSLPEWIRQDSSLTAEQKAHLEAFVAPQSFDWQICNQLANQQKHAGHTHRRAKKAATQAGAMVRAVHIKAGGAGFMILSPMAIVGAGEDITIECGGHQESALAFAIRVFRHFHYIFEVAPIPIADRTRANVADPILVA